MEKPTFEQVVSQYRVSMRRTLLRLGVRIHDVDDVAQEVLRAVARGLPAFEPLSGVAEEVAVGAWLFAICERQAANHRRRMFRRAETPRDNAELDGMAGVAPTPEASCLAAERVERLHSILATMEARRRDVLVAHELHGVAMGDVALDLGIPVNTAWNRLRLARAALRAAWEARERRSGPHEVRQSGVRGCTMSAPWIERARNQARRGCKRRRSPARCDLSMRDSRRSSLSPPTPPGPGSAPA